MASIEMKKIARLVAAGGVESKKVMEQRRAHWSEQRDYDDDDEIGPDDVRYWFRYTVYFDDTVGTMRDIDFKNTNGVFYDVLMRRWGSFRVSHHTSEVVNAVRARINLLTA